MANQIIKSFRPYNGEQLAMAQIHADHYGNSLEHINNMADMLKEDFPDIKDEDIKIHKYGGARVKGITFVEVQLGNRRETPAGYNEVKDLEYIL